MSKKEGHTKDKNCGKCRGECKKCIKIIIQQPALAQPFIGMSVYKQGDLFVPSVALPPVAPIVIGNWSDDRINGRRFFYVEPSISFDVTTGTYTVTKAGKYRSAANIQIENQSPDPALTLSAQFAFVLNGVVFTSFFCSSSVKLDTVSSTISLQLNEGDKLQLYAFPNVGGVTPYTIRGTVNPNAENPVRTNWSVSRFAD